MNKIPKKKDEQLTNMLPVLGLLPRHYARSHKPLNSCKYQLYSVLQLTILPLRLFEFLHWHEKLVSTLSHRHRRRMENN